MHEQSRCAGALARRFVDSVLGSACSGWCGCRMSVWAGCFDFAGLNLPGGISCLGGGGGGAPGGGGAGARSRTRSAGS